VVGDGIEAVRAAREGGFAVILLDWQMPRMDGLITTRMIRGEYLGLSRHERLSLPVPHGVIWRLRGGGVETIHQ